MTDRRGVAILKVLAGVVATGLSLTVLEMSDATQARINSVGLLVLGAGLAFMANRYWVQRSERTKRREGYATEHNALKDRINELETKLRLVDQAVIPLSAAFQAILVKELTHFHTPVTDALLAKLGPPSTLTDAEEDQLAAALAEREITLNGQIDNSERDAARMLPMVIKRVKAEASCVDEGSEMQIVAVPTGDEKKVEEKGEEDGA